MSPLPSRRTDSAAALPDNALETAEEPEELPLATLAHVRRAGVVNRLLEAAETPQMRER